MGMRFTQHASSSAGNLYTLSNNTEQIIIEAGIPFREIQKALRFSLGGFSGCLITHEHQDHAKAARDLLKAGVDVYMSKGTADALNLKSHRLHIIEPGKQFKIGGFSIMPFSIEHDCKEPLGFLVQSGADKLLFVTDTHYVRYRFNGLTLIAVECNHSLDLITELEPVRRKRLMETHMSLETCVELLKANDLSKVRQIHLLHLSSGNSDAELFQRTIEDLTGIPVHIK